MTISSHSASRMVGYQNLVLFYEKLGYEVDDCDNEGDQKKDENYQYYPEDDL